jgi:salicylate hydroxylase
MKIAIVGAGMGGLTTALALHRHGLKDVIVLERTPEFAEVGAAVQVSNNGARVLLHYGLKRDLEVYACKSEGTWYRDLGTDDELYNCRLGEWGEQHYGAPYYQIHRADLHRILCENIPAGWIKTSTHVTGVQVTSEGPVLDFANGQKLAADVVIGADGFRSTIREYVAPGITPRYSGFICWRALIPAERISDLGLARGCYDWIGPDRVVAVYWCSAGKKLNFLANVPAEDPRPESWSAIDGSQELKKAFSHANPTIRRLIDAVENPFITGMFDRSTPVSFHRDSVVLLGDAAHPVVPYLAAGVTQAMEDAHVLAVMLSRASAGEKSVEEALAEYGARRRRRVDKIREVSIKMLELSHVRGDEEVRQRNDQFKALQRTDPNGTQLRGWVWGYDVIADTERSIDSASATQGPRSSIWAEGGVNGLGFGRT